MVPTRESLERSYPAVAESIRLVRVAAAAMAATHGFAEERLEAIRLAVSEAVTNAVRHAYPDGEGEIHLVAGIAGGELWVLIADDGCGFQTRSRIPGLGWGMPLIAHASDEFTIADRSHGGTELWMRFRQDAGGY